MRELREASAASLGVNQANLLLLCSDEASDEVPVLLRDGEWLSHYALPHDEKTVFCFDTVAIRFVFSLIFSWPLPSFPFPLPVLPALTESDVDVDNTSALRPPATKLRTLARRAGTCWRRAKRAGCAPRSSTTTLPPR